MHYPLASLWKRTLVYIFDLAITLILGWLVANYFFKNPELTRLLQVLFFALNHLGGGVFLGRSVGKYLFNLIILKADYSPVTRKEIIYRETLGRFMSDIVFNLGYLWAFIDSKGQSWHDKVGNTIVVDKKGKNPKALQRSQNIWLRWFLLLNGFIVLFLTFLNKIRTYALIRELSSSPDGLSQRVSEGLKIGLGITELWIAIGVVQLLIGGIVAFLFYRIKNTKKIRKISFVLNILALLLYLLPMFISLLLPTFFPDSQRKILPSGESVLFINNKLQ